MFISTAVLALAVAATQVSAATQTVMVGQGGLVFSPDTVTAAVGDVIEFQYPSTSLAHSATESTFDNPCTAMASGFDSGLMTGSSASPATFSVSVNSTDPIWVFCKQVGHCQLGMVMAVNAPTSGNTFQAFQAKAQGNSASSASSSASESSSAASSSAASSSAASSAAASSSVSSSASASSSGLASVSSALSSAHSSASSVLSSASASKAASGSASSPSATKAAGASSRMAVAYGLSAIAVLGAAVSAVL